MLGSIGKTNTSAQGPHVLLNQCRDQII